MIIIVNKIYEKLKEIQQLVETEINITVKSKSTSELVTNLDLLIETQLIAFLQSSAESPLL